jgi:hypothetical protein
MDATDNELLETQYYGCCVVDFYNHGRPHASLGPGIGLGSRRFYLTGAPIHHVMSFLSMTPAFRCPYGLSSGSLSDVAPASSARV